MADATGRIMAWTVGLAFLASIFESTLPQDILFLWPLVGLFCAALAIAGAAGSRMAHQSLLYGWCGLWLILLFANMYWSLWPEATLWAAFSLGCLPLMMSAGALTLSNEALWSRCRCLLVLVGAFFAGWLLLQYFTTGGRSNGPFLDANAAGALVNLFLVPLLIVGWCRPWHRHNSALFAGLVLFFSAALLTTFSRGAIGTALIVALTSAIGMLLFGVRYSRANMGVSVLAITVACALVALGPQAAFNHLTQDPQSGHFLLGRILIWKSTWAMYLQHPWLGNGLSTFSMLYPAHRSLMETGTTGDMAHNDYLQSLAEGGPLLLAMVLIFVTWLLVSAIRLARKQTHSSRSVEALALCMGMLTVMAHALVNFVFYVTPICLLIGIYAGRVAAADSSCTAMPAHPRRLTILCFGTLFLFLSLLLVSSYVSSRWFDPGNPKTGQYRLDSPRYQRALQISFINPLDSWSRRYLAQTEAKTALSLYGTKAGAAMARTALTDLHQLFERKTVDCIGRTLQAKLVYTFQDDVHSAPGGNANPRRLLRQAMTNDPTCLLPYLALATIQQKAGNPTGAIETLQSALRFYRIPGAKLEGRLDLLYKLGQLLLKQGQSDKARAAAHMMLEQAPDNAAAKSLLKDAKKD